MLVASQRFRDLLVYCFPAYSTPICSWPPCLHGFDSHSQRRSTNFCLAIKVASDLSWKLKQLIIVSHYFLYDGSLFLLPFFYFVILFFSLYIKVRMVILFLVKQSTLLLELPNTIKLICLSYRVDQIYNRGEISLKQWKRTAKKKRCLVCNHPINFSFFFFSKFRKTFQNCMYKS